MRKATWVAAAVVALALMGAKGTLAQEKTVSDQATTPGCTNATVDSFGRNEGIEYRYWMLKLQKVVKEDDRKMLADTMVFYPFLWNKPDGPIQIKNKSEFLKNYDEIMTPQLKEKIAKQNVKCLPGDDQGAVVAGTELRYAKFADGEFRVTTVAPPGKTMVSKLPWE
jgi:hypothetical protein